MSFLITKYFHNVLELGCKELYVFNEKPHHGLRNKANKLLVKETRSCTQRIIEEDALFLCHKQTSKPARKHIVSVV